MNIFQATILGIVQGATEFLPISSSAHLVLLPRIFSWTEQPTSFDIVLHSATLLATVIYFKNDLIKIAANISKNKTLILNLFIVSLPAGIIGLLFKDFIESTAKRNWVIVTMLVLVGLVFIFIDKFTRRKKQIKNLTKSDSLTVGLFQATALLRGTSRSGITIVGGLARGLSRKDAAKFAFLAGIPIMFAASAKQFLDFGIEGTVNLETSHLAAGFFSSFLSGIFSIHLLISFLKKHSLKWFGFYRILIAIIALLLL